jgi:hypothetical protein
MKLAYHLKTNNNGWSHVVTAPIESKKWHDQDVWAYNHMVSTGELVLTMGSSMWQLIQE